MGVLIRQALPEDLVEIVKIEQEVEPDNPAELSALLDRLAMFQDGFLTVWLDGILAGYAESCIWNEKIPEFSPEKDFFKNRHTPEGTTLYIIFIGVRTLYQRQGLGSMLIRSLLDLARTEGML
jgi:ribosomal protein S18 acetylase RimI-like enzyme